MDMERARTLWTAQSHAQNAAMMLDLLSTRLLELGSVPPSILGMVLAAQVNVRAVRIHVNQVVETEDLAGQWKAEQLRKFREGRDDVR